MCQASYPSGISTSFSNHKVDSGERQLKVIPAWLTRSMCTYIAHMKLANIMPYGASPVEAGRARSMDGAQKNTIAYIEPSITQFMIVIDATLPVCLLAA